jgi:hypothetical protein
MMTAFLNNKLKNFQKIGVFFNEMPTGGGGDDCVLPWLVPEAADVYVVAYVSRSVWISDRLWNIGTGF